MRAWINSYFWDLFWIAVFLAVAMWSFAARADVAYVSRGTGCAVWQTGATTPGCTPSMPTGIDNNDVLIADVASSANTAHTCPTNCTGWTALSNAGATTGGRHSVWWYRMSSTTTPTAPTFGGPSTSTLVAAIRAYRGVWRGGTPLAGTTTAAAEAAGTTITGAQVVTTSTNAMPIFSGGVRGVSTFRTAGGGVTDPPTPNTLAGDVYYGNGSTTSTVFFAHDGNLTSVSGTTITAPTIVQSASLAGRSIVYALAPQPTTVSVSGTKAWATCNATPCTTAWATTSGATPVTLVISVVYGSAVTLNSVTDTASNVWTQYARGSNATDSQYAEVWATTSTASAITSVTMVWSGTPTSTGFTGYEVLGVNHIGTTSTTSGASASELTSTITPTGTDSLVVWSSYYNSASTTRQWFDSARGSQWNIGGLLSGQPNKWGVGGTNQFYTQGESSTWGTLGTVAGQWCGAALNLAYVPPASAGEGFMRGWWGGLWTIPRRPVLLDAFPMIKR